MATGSKANYNNANKNTAQGVAALQPKSYSDPFGTLNKGVFTPNITPNQQGALEKTYSGMNALTGQVSQPFDVNSYYNNPFYQSTAQMLQDPIDRQYQQDKLSLQNNLNAQNQTGSSYDAYSNSLLNQQHQYNDQMAQLQARSASADAFNQAYNNSISGLGSLGTSYGQQLAGIYQPMSAATGYQNAIAGLQQGQGQLYGNMAQAYTQKKTALDNLMALAGSASSAYSSNQNNQAMQAYAKAMAGA